MPYALQPPRRALWASGQPRTELSLSGDQELSDLRLLEHWLALTTLDLHGWIAQADPARPELL